VLPATSEKSLYYQDWLETLQGQHSVIIGTRKSIFLPVPQLGLIIIDKVSEYGYKEEQYPYYHALAVAKQRSQLSTAQLIIGDATPQLDEWAQIQKKQLQTVSTGESTKPQITLIDTSAHKKLFPEVLLDHIEEVTNRGERAAIFYNRKGEGRFYRCRDCETAIYCPRCDALLNVYDEVGKTVLRCAHCGYETTPPYRCESCQSYRLGSVGLGVNSIAKILKERFPGKSIGVVSKDSDQTTDLADISVCTSQMFYLSPTAQFGLLATVHIDHILHGTSWRTNEEAYLMLARLAERTSHLIIQTSQTEHPVIQSFCKNNLDSLYQHELEQRQLHGFPPIKAVTQLIYAGIEENKVKKEAEKLHSTLLAAWPNQNNLIYAPSPLGSGKRRDKYRYQIIVKLPVTDELAKLIPTTWQIDPAPQEIG
jgi:primosomal protein N' (replication factor Y)